MAVEWEFTPMVIDRDGKSDVVASFEARCSADGWGTRVYVGVDLPAPGETFIDYSQLTKQDFLKWLDQAAGEDDGATSADLAAAAEARAKAAAEPKPTPKAVPWGRNND